MTEGTRLQDKHKEFLAKLEALLFLYGEPLSMAKIQDTLVLTPSEIEELVRGLEGKLNAEGRGLALVTLGGKVQLTTKPEFGILMEKFLKEEMSEDLTPASLETLALIAYCGPISRSRLEYLRGVNSAFILRSLRMRGLADRFSDPEHPQSYLYEPSIELLKHLGLKKKEELPDYEKFKALLQRAESVSLP